MGSRTKLQATSRFPKRRKNKVNCSRTKLQLQVDFSERLPKIKKILTAMAETTSYIQIFKKKKIMSPRYMADTAATSGFFRKNSQNKEGIEHHRRNYKLLLDFQKEETIKSTVNGRNYSYKWIFPKDFPKL